MKSKAYKIYGYDEYDNLIYVADQPSEHKALALIARLEMSGDYRDMFWVYG